MLFAAHHAVLRAQVLDVNNHQLGFLLPAGDGVFVCICVGGHEVSRDEPSVYIRARTWLHNDQLYDDQRPLAVDVNIGHRMGESLLLPAPWRRLIHDTGTSATHVMTWKWAPRLGKSLASPQGRA